ncbi:hypothetical protein [Microbacterium rhizomatis]|uniref:SGNH/GDSL hydrolase family protein n=1 Tax=Microbacterium rhizomatis TaxID=1631477 RepID=A0A5J5J6B2_9MICO|nr:hypothetical protein [Microbacterium rhizomatis]KAA9110398.1 hypothetical protein F6B43_01525 [Microbacterium rhizomatis]
MSPQMPVRPRSALVAGERAVDPRRAPARRASPGRGGMWENPEVVLGPLFWGLFRASTRQQRGWCYPAEPAVVSIPGVDPIRILIIGDGPAAGCGVLIHELGIAGTLARYVAEHAARGAVVSVIAQPDASARSTLGCLAGVDFADYDAVVLMLATTDAFCLTGRRSWQRSMTELVEFLTSSGPASVFVTSAASMHLTRSLTPVARRITGKHARLLDAETREVCARSGTPMIDLDAANDLTPRTYARWGRRIGAHIIPSLHR